MAITQRAEKEIRIGRAVAGYRNGLYGTIREAAQAEGVSHTTVGHRLHGRKTKTEAHEWQQHFTASAELAIEKWCKKQDDRGLPLDLKTFTDFLNYLLKEQAKRNGLTPEPEGIGKNYVRQYLDRHLTLQVR